MPKSGVITLQIKDPAVEYATLVLDDIVTEDRPAAVGYFVLSTLRDWYLKHGKLGIVVLRAGVVDATDLDAKRSQLNIISPGMIGGEYGEVYKLVVAIERGDKGLLSNGSGDV